MDAKQLISLFDAHPKAFTLIGARRSERPDGGLFNYDGMELPPWAEAETALAQQWVKWVYGACVLEFVRRQWELPLMWRVNGVLSWHINDGHEIDHQTPLLAMLAAIEASLMVDDHVSVVSVPAGSLIDQVHHRLPNGYRTWVGDKDVTCMLSPQHPGTSFRSFFTRLLCALFRGVTRVRKPKTGERVWSRWYREGTERIWVSRLDRSGKRMPPELGYPSGLNDHSELFFPWREGDIVTSLPPVDESAARPAKEAGHG